MPLDSSIESDSTDYDDPKIKILRQSLSMNATNKVMNIEDFLLNMSMD